MLELLLSEARRTNHFTALIGKGARSFGVTHVLPSNMSSSSSSSFAPATNIIAHRTCSHLHILRWPAFVVHSIQSSYSWMLTSSLWLDLGVTSCDRHFQRSSHSVTLFGNDCSLMGATVFCHVRCTQLEPSADLSFQSRGRRLDIADTETNLLS